jgi:hypothetical protein
LSFFAPRAVIAAENLLLRHQLIVLPRSSPRPRPTGPTADRHAGRTGTEAD